MMEGDLTWGGEHTIQNTDDVVQNFTPESYIIVLKMSPPKIQSKVKKIKIRKKIFS